MTVDDYERLLQEKIAEKYQSLFPNRVPKNYFRVSLRDLINSDSVSQDIEDLLNIALENLRKTINLSIRQKSNHLDAIEFYVDEENIENLYKRLQRKTPKAKRDNFFTMLEGFDTPVPKLKRFISFLLSTRTTEPFDIENLNDAEKLLKLATYSESIEDAHFIREISAKVLGDSKYYENNKLEPKLARLLKKINEDDNTFNDYDDIPDSIFLERFGFYKYPEIFELTGPLVLKKSNNKDLDFSFFDKSGVLSSMELDGIIETNNNAKRVILFENKASYYSSLKNRKEDELFIFEAGFLSYQRRKLISMIYQSAPDIEFYHSGDIDVGGFDIFLEIKSIIPTIQPLNMDVNTITLNSEYALELSENDKKRLAHRLKDNRYQEFWSVFEIMLLKNIKLEQENLL